MSVYEYEALDERGRERKGFVDASGVTAARQQLREKGIYPVEIRPAREKKAAALAGALEVGFLQKVSPKEIALFTRQLSTLLGAGIPFPFCWPRPKIRCCKRFWRRSGPISMKEKA